MWVLIPHQMSRYTNPTPLRNPPAEEDEYLKLRIETDADNAVKRISYDVPYEEYQVEYDIVVGNEVIDEAMNHPEFPEEEKLYKYEIKNRTKTKIRDIVNPATIEITYR